ncbi:MAG TPA: hypothetical protein PLF11_06785 [Bacillota bacterium]|nr:hypothetical protein [Bacillota bacterium]
MEPALNIAFLFGLGVLALTVLLLAGCFARGKVMIVLAAAIAVVLMVLECLLLNLLAGIGSATSTSQQGYQMLKITIAVFVLSLAAYFPLALARIKARKRKATL